MNSFCYIGWQLCLRLSQCINRNIECIILFSFLGVQNYVFKKPSDTFICHRLSPTCPADSAWMWVCLLPSPGRYHFCLIQAARVWSYIQKIAMKWNLYCKQVQHITKLKTFINYMKVWKDVDKRWFVRLISHWPYVDTNLSPCVHEFEAGLPCRGRFCCLSYCSFPSSSRSAAWIECCQASACIDLLNEWG